MYLIYVYTCTYSHVYHDIYLYISIYIYVYIYGQQDKRPTCKHGFTRGFHVCKATGSHLSYLNISREAYAWMLIFICQRGQELKVCPGVKMLRAQVKFTLLFWPWCGAHGSDGSGGSTKDQEVHHLVDDTRISQFRVFPTVYTLIEVGGVQWMESATCEGGLSPNPDQDWSVICEGWLSTCCSHDDRHEWTWYWCNNWSSDGRSEAPWRALILESVDVWKNYKNRLPARSSAGVIWPSGANRSEVMFILYSRDLRMWFSMISSRMISFQKLMDKSCQVLHPFLTLYPWKQRIRRSKRAQWSRCSWNTGWVPVWLQNGYRECVCGCYHKYTEGTVYCTQVLYWVGGGCCEECGKEEEWFWPVCSPLKYKWEIYYWTQKLNTEDYGVDKPSAGYFLLLKRVNTVEKH